MNWMDIQLLAGHVMGYTSEEDQEKILQGDIDIEAELFEKYEMDLLDHFAKIAELLLPLTMPAKTPLTGETIQGYLQPDENGATFIYKQAAAEGVQKLVPTPLRDGQIRWIWKNFMPAARIVEALRSGGADIAQLEGDLIEVVAEVERIHRVRSMMEIPTDKAKEPAHG